MTNSQDSSRRDSMKAVQYKVPGNAFSVAATVLLHYEAQPGRKDSLGAFSIAGRLERKVA